MVRRLDEAIRNEHINLYKHNNFKNIQKIGSGGFGKIYKAIFNDDVTFALKSYKSGTENIKEVVNEVNYDVFTSEWNNNIILFFFDSQ